MADHNTRFATQANNGAAIDASLSDVLTGAAASAPGVVLTKVLAGTAAGAAIANPAAPTGLYVTRLPLLSGCNADGSALVASSPGTGNFTVVVVLGTSLGLTGHAARNATLVDNAIWESPLPLHYLAGQNLTLTVDANYTVSGGTGGTRTVAAKAYRLTDTGSLSGGNLIATAAQALTASAADYAFTISGATLNPNDRLLIEVTTSIQESGNTGTVTGVVNSVRFV